MQLTDELESSIRKKMSSQKKWSLEESYHLALRTEKVHMKRKHESKQWEEKEKKILFYVVAKSVDCESGVHVVEERVCEVQVVGIL